MEEKKKKISDAFSYSSRLSEEDGSQLGIGIGIGNKKKTQLSSFKLVDCKKKKKKKKKREGQIYKRHREKRMLVFGGIGVTVVW